MIIRCKTETCETVLVTLTSPLCLPCRNDQQQRRNSGVLAPRRPAFTQPMPAKSGRGPVHFDPADGRKAPVGKASGGKFLTTALCGVALVMVNAETDRAAVDCPRCLDALNGGGAPDRNDARIHFRALGGGAYTACGLLDGDGVKAILRPADVTCAKCRALLYGDAPEPEPAAETSTPDTPPHTAAVDGVIDALTASIDRLAETQGALNPDTDAQHDDVTDALADMRRALAVLDNARTTLAVANI